ncbi:MAG: hypothetical protein KAS32_22355, partial [Candidatus Peribacteraceae bacterium]|nr:hypothetical protein [Candidatus Peribacteraceae bacterium]
SPKLARTIVQMTPKDEDIHMTVASPDLWRRIQHDEREPETTVADLMARNGLYIEKANDSRVTGWEICRWMLEWNKEEKPIPKCRIFSNCEEVFKDLGRLIHDENNPEDVKKMKNDDTGDSFRYGAVHIYNARDPVEPKGEREKFIESIVVDRHQGGRPQGNKWGDRI